jgi:N-methylhydantoinase A
MPCQTIITPDFAATPGSANTVNFSSTGAANFSTTLDNAFSIAGLNFTNVGSAVTIAPGTGGTLQIGSGGIAVMVDCLTDNRQRTVADVRHDHVRTINRALNALDEGVIAQVFRQQLDAGHATIVRERVEVTRIDAIHSADMQFQGQSHILSVTIPDPGITLPALRALFEAAYWQRFGVELPEIRPVLVNLHTAVIGRRRPVSLKAIAAAMPRASLREAEAGRRQVWFTGGWVDTPVYRREWLPEGAVFMGPAIVEQLDCTTVIEPGTSAILDAIGNLILKV